MIVKEMENLENFLRLVGGEPCPIIFVGQINQTFETEDGKKYNEALLVVTALDEDNNIIRLSDSIGEIEIPKKPDKEKEKEFEEFARMVEEQKKKVEDLFREKGFDVVRGIVLPI